MLHWRHFLFYFYLDCNGFYKKKTIEKVLIILNPAKKDS